MNVIIIEWNRNCNRLPSTVFDATGKGRSGLAYGYVSDIGNMDECLSIDTTVDDWPLKGQYCMVEVRLPMMNKSNVDYLRKVDFDVRGTELQDTVYELYAKVSTEMNVSWLQSSRLT